MKKLFGRSKHGKDTGASGSTKGTGGYYDIKEKSLAKLYKAAWTGDHKKIATFQQDINTPDSEKRMALHLASYRGHDKVVGALLTFGARTDAVDAENRSPLYRAVQLNRVPCAQLLLNSGSKREDEALVVAANNCSTEMLELLLESWHPHRLNAIAGKSLLHLAVTNGNAEVLTLLLQRASGPDEVDADGRTPLMLACQDGHADLAALLLKAGADPFARDSAGRSCADFATGQAACARLLADARPPKAAVKTATPSVTAAVTSGSKPQTSSDYEEDESKSDYAIPTLDSERSERSLSRGGGGGGGGRRAISLNDFHAGGKVDLFDPDTQQIRSLKVPAVRDNRRRSRSPSPAVSASFDSGSEDDLGSEAAKVRLSGQRSESARASLAAVPETANRASVKQPADRSSKTKSHSGQNAGQDDGDDDDDWSESISVDKDPAPKINLKQAMEKRKRQAVLFDDEAADWRGEAKDDDTIASDFPPTLTPRSGGKATPRDSRQQNAAFQRQESDWDASEISEVAAVPTEAKLGVAKSPADAKDDEDAESDWDDSVAAAAPVAADSSSKVKQAQGADGDSDSDWDDSETTAARSKPKDSAREEPVSDWDTSTEAGEPIVSPRRPPPPPPPSQPPHQHQQEQLGRRLSKTDKDALQPIAEESADTPASRRKVDKGRTVSEADSDWEDDAKHPPGSDNFGRDDYDSQRKEGADTVIAAMLQENQFSDTPPPAAADAAGVDNSSLSDDEGSLQPVPQEVARLQAELATATQELRDSKADCRRSKAERDNLTEVVAEQERRLSEAQENLRSEEAQRAALADKLAEQRETALVEARAREDARAEAEALRTERDSALARLRAAEAEVAEAREALENERQAAARRGIAGAGAADEDADYEGLSAAAAAARDEAEANRRRADAAEREAVELRAEVETLRGRLRAQETRWSDERAQLESQAAEAEAASREALAKMALSLEAARNEALELRQRVDAERAEAGQLRARLTALTESAGQGDKQVADLAGQLHQAREAAVRMEEQLAAERAKAAGSQDELRRALDAAKEATEESRRFRSELAASQAELRETRAETSRLRETEAALASAEGRLAGASQANTDLRDQLQRLAAAASKGDEKDSQLQQRLCDILNGYRDDFDKTRNSMERSQGCLAAELAQARSDLRASEQRCEKQQTELLSLRHEHSGLMRKLSQSEADLACVKEAKVELEKEKIGLQYEAGSLKTDVTGLRGEIVALKEELAALRSGGGVRQRASSNAGPEAEAAAAAAAAAATASGSAGGKMTSWRADEYEERIRHQEVRNAKLEMSLDFEQRKVRGLSRELDSLNEMSVDELRRTCLDMATERDRLSSDCQHYRQLYDREKRVRQKLTDELERANNSEAQAAAAVSLDKDRQRLPSGISQFSFQQPLMQPQQLQQQQQYNLYSSNQSLSSPDPILQQRLRSELDRSISKHLESDSASRLYTSKTRSTVNLSRTVAESDPSYLHFLKNKYHV